MGKKSEPTADELEFVYQCLSRNLDNAMVLKEMQGTEFPRRSAGFIQRRRKEFYVVRRVLEEQLRKDIAPIDLKKKEEHYEYLSTIARAIMTAFDYLENISENINKEEQHGEYIQLIGDRERPLSRAELSASLQKNLAVVNGITPGYDGLNESKIYPHTDIECLIYHLEEECSEVKTKGLYKAIEENPYKIIDNLGMLCRKETFKGTCPVCQDW